MEIDMVNRDPNNLNEAYRASYEYVIGEPEAPRSTDCLWRNSYKCYTCGLNCCYKFLTALCGIFIALYWGCDFALLVCDSIWCRTPGVRSYYIWCGTCQTVCGACTKCLVEPCCQACALLFSRIHYYRK